MAPLAAAEPMNATTNHSKIRVKVTLPKESVIAGRFVTGKMEVECKSDKLGIGVIMVELFAFQELTSRDHSARMTFLHTKRSFQGPGLPPSNAVYGLLSDELPGDYYQAKRGHSTFLFRIPLPPSSPASINFANGLARIRYEVRGSVGIFWKGDRQFVIDKEEVGVLESSEEDLEEGVVVVGEGGRFWVHGRLVGGLLVAGESACVELQVKNHSSRKNTGLTLTLKRSLLLPNSDALQISDTILTVPFKGQEYIVPSGGEGVAHLVFDVPATAKSVRGGTYYDEEGDTNEALFSIQANVEVKIAMGFGTKDIVMDIRVTIAHPDALPEVLPQLYTTSPPQPRPLPQPIIQQHTQQLWVPPSPYYYQSPQHQSPTDLYPPQQSPYTHLNLAPRPLPVRPSSAGPLMASINHDDVYASPSISGLPLHTVLLPLPSLHSTPPHIHPSHNYSHTQPSTQSPSTPQYNHPPNDYSPTPPAQGEREEGKGIVASRISRHLRETSVVGRGRSVSPLAHRFGYPSQVQIPEPWGTVGHMPEGALPLSSALDVGGNEGGSGGGDPVLYSPRPQIRHKQSFTSMSLVDVNGGGGPHMTMRSENVLELEKIAAGLDADGTADMVCEGWMDREGRKGKVNEKEKGKGKGKEKEKRKEEDMNMNKTLPVPPPATKPRQHIPKAGTNAKLASATTKTNLESLFNPLSALSSPQISSQSQVAVPPTPTLVACKRPPRLAGGTSKGGGGGGGGAESGLDALERRLLAQVGTRKPEKEKIADVRDILSINPPLSTLAPPNHTLTALDSSVPSTSTTPNLPEDKVKSSAQRSGAGSIVASASASGDASASASVSGERGVMSTLSVHDESAISSLTLDQSSSAGEHVVEREREREDEEQEQEQEQESVDGGKTHRAGKSVVGVETYFQQSSHRRERGDVESYLLERNTAALPDPLTITTDTSPNPPAPPGLQPPSTPKKRTATGDKSKKSAQARGRVTAWLGKIDPDAPPPQEEIIPPSPSVVKPIEWDDLAAGEGDGDVDEELDQRIMQGLEFDFTSQEQREREMEASKVRLRSPSRSPISALAQVSTQAPPDMTPSQLTATPAAVSPNPRSSGFMPIETMQAQRDSITKSMTKSMMRRVYAHPGGLAKVREDGKQMKGNVEEEARRVMDIWSDGLPDPGPQGLQGSPSVRLVKPDMVGTLPTFGTARVDKNKEVEKLGKEMEGAKEKQQQRYPFMVPGIPRTQTIRTDRRVSPPSANAGGAGARNAGVGKPIIKVVEPPPSTTGPALATTTTTTNGKSPKPRLTPSPVSYANVAASGAALRSSPTPIAAARVGEGGAKMNARLPVFPPSKDAEANQYDVKSARGGKGGKVTHVASLWASVAAGNGPTGGGGGGGNKAGDAAKHDVGGMRRDIKTSVPTVAGDGQGSPLSNRGRPLATGEKKESQPNGPPLLVPKRSFTSVVAAAKPSPGPVIERNRPQSKTPTPSSKPPKPQPPPPTTKPKLYPLPVAKTPRVSTDINKPPPVVRKSPIPPPSSEPRSNGSGPEKSTRGGPPIPVSMAKSPSVPALVSSSFATPTLSSTASLIRPLGRQNSGNRSNTATVAVGLPGIGKGDYKSAVIAGIRNAGSDRGVNGPGVRDVVRKKSSLAAVGEEAGDASAMAQMPTGKLKTTSPGSVRTPIAVVGNPNKSGNAASASAKQDDGASMRDMAFGQARLRNLIKKYQGGNA